MDVGVWFISALLVSAYCQPRHVDNHGEARLGRWGKYLAVLS